MKTLPYAWILYIASIGAVAILSLVLFGGSRNVQGSVPLANEYHATTTRDYQDAQITNLAVLQSYAGSLGSVVITGADAGTMTLYDATTSRNGAIYGTTTLATFPASAATGTYTFDSIFRYGLLIEITGNAPTSTITFR